ncbi:unnamed protein product [Durusdinium trenchii]|uniref:Protein kinase domain-containing protein n=2 Tax=Durusdinium trenchii TaxID=1381693 RepID=A0ABP0R1J0_9DINO
MPSPTSALLPVANTLAVGVRSFVLQQYYTFEYDLGLWAFGAVQVIKDRRSGTLKTCKAVEKTRLMDVHGTGDRLRRLTEIQHPMLLPVTDILEDSSHFFIISPHAAGGDMGDWLDRLASDEEVIEEETCAMYVAQVLASLVHCHSCGVFHDELRARSVLLTSREANARVLLGDVGLLAALGRGCKDGRAGDLRGVGMLSLAMLLGLAPGKVEEDLNSHLLNGELWSARSREAFDFVQTLLAEDVECTAPLALSHPWLRNVLLRPGLADDLAREDALRRLACYQAALLLVPVEMAHRDLERLLKDFQRMDQDGDALLASRLAMQLLLARRGATKRGSEVAVGVCDVRGCGTVDFSAMAAAALMADLLPDGFMKQRVDDMWSALQQLFFEAYGSDDGMVDRSVVLEKVSNSVGGLLEKYGDVEFEEILGSFDDDIYQESFQSRLMDSAGHGTPMALFEWGFLAEEPDSWFASLYRSCGQPMRRREAVRC